MSFKGSKAAGGGYLPISFDVRHARVLVAGAGAVAARRIAALLRREASVTVVAKVFSASVRRLVESGEVRGIEGPFLPGHLDGMSLAFAATSDPQVNRSVAREAARRGIPVNVADAPGDCSFILPAVVDGGEFTLAVSTGGRNPGAARAIREFLEDRSEEIAVRLERGRRRPRIRALAGTVHIVGAGPGDPDLLTVRALGLIRSADVVIHDYLVPPEILSLAPARALRLCYARRGRTAGHGAALKQEAIHAAMVRLAREGKSVVRLKSGDPLVFGRGGEEAEALDRAGIPFEIVPGITAAVGCAAAANVPLTHRGLTSSVTLVAGHEADGKRGKAVDWTRLPKDGTLAVYMGVARIGELAREIGEAGFPPGTPVAVVENGTRGEQRVFKGTLAGLPGLAAERAIRSPAVLFVGGGAGVAIIKETGSGRDDGSVAQGV